MRLTKPAHGVTRCRGQSGDHGGNRDYRLWPGLSGPGIFAFVEGSREPVLSRQARLLRRLHTVVGLGEVVCLAYLWTCGLTRRRDRWLGVSIGVLTTEGVALLVARGCPLGIIQRRAGDDVPMFELWFGPRLAPFAIPTLAAVAVAGGALVLARPPGTPPLRDATGAPGVAIHRPVVQARLYTARTCAREQRD